MFVKSALTDHLHHKFCVLPMKLVNHFRPHIYAKLNLDVLISCLFSCRGRGGDYRSNMQCNMYVKKLCESIKTGLSIIIYTIFMHFSVLCIVYMYSAIKNLCGTDLCNRRLTYIICINKIVHIIVIRYLLKYANFMKFFHLAQYIHVAAVEATFMVERIHQSLKIKLVDEPSAKILFLEFLLYSIYQVQYPLSAVC